MNKTISFSEKIASNIVDSLTKNKTEQFDSKTILKCKFGFASFLITLSKAIIIYSFAYILNILPSLAIFHISYTLIRQFAFGAHAQTSLQCLVYSLVIFLGIPFILSKYQITFPYYITFIIIILNLFLLAKYAGKGSFKNPISNVNTQKKLKICCILILLCGYAISLFLPPFICTLVVSSFTLCTVMTLPILEKIIYKRSTNND